MALSKGAEPARPLWQPVVGPQYCLSYPAQFTVRKKVLAFSNGDWTIENASGNVVFKVDGRAMSLREKRWLLDAEGNRVLRMERKLFSIHKKWHVYMGTSKQEICSVKKSSVLQICTSMNVFLPSNLNRQSPDFKLKGNFFERNVTIFQGSQQIAQITRQLTVTNVVIGRDTFGVTVLPGADYALVFALIVIMDAVYLQDAK